MIKAIIFDAGGVLHTSVSKEVKKDICQTMGVTEKEYLAACKNIIPIYNTGRITDEKEFWIRFVEFTKSRAEIPEYSLWSREFIHKYHQNREVMEIARKLKKNGYTIAVLSNTIEPHAKIVRDKGGYSPFDVVTLSFEVGVRKPDPKIYKFTLSRLGVDAEETVFIDDSDENVQAATALGIHGVVFKDAHQLETELNNIGVSLVK